MYEYMLVTVTRGKCGFRVDDSSDNLDFPGVLLVLGSLEGFDNVRDGVIVGREWRIWDDASRFGLLEDFSDEATKDLELPIKKRQYKLYNWAIFCKLLLKILVRITKQY